MTDVKRTGGVGRQSTASRCLHDPGRPGLEEAQLTETRASFAAEADVLASVRAFVIGELRERGVEPSMVERAVTAVSELATNAVIHARTPFELRIRTEDERVWIGVVDSNPRQPLPPPFEAGLVSGRGLHVVAGLADEWGSELLDRGKVVWCAIERERVGQ